MSAVQRKGRRVVDKVQDQRSELPIRQMADSVVQFIGGHETSIVLGETGCGKSTQVPQLLYENGMHQDLVIGITQPRRVAAISLATRVADEMNVTLGVEVGYAVRFEEVASDSTHIFYLTEGMLVREAMYGRLLERYSIVVLDEVHERTLQTDVLFSIVKQAQRLRIKMDMAPLKVVVMSATMDVDHISAYFNDAPVLFCEGRLHPINLFYGADCGDDYLFNTLVSIFQIHNSRPLDGDILCFLTGQEEIETTVASCRELLEKVGDKSVVVLPFYASLPTHQQMKVFKWRKRKKKRLRRIIIATNVAETSLTIPNIRYVIDSGKVKVRVFEPTKGVEMLRVVNASKAQVDQRAGRAGRQGEGFCYRLYTEDQYMDLPEFNDSEVHRCSLATVCLQMFMMGVNDVRTFDLIEQPSAQSVRAAYMLLKDLGAIEVGTRGRFVLTDTGRTMAAFPVDTKFARTIIAAADLSCTDEVITIVGLLSVGNVFVNNCHRDDQIARCPLFHAAEGDLIRLFKLAEFSRTLPPDQLKYWCLENGVHYRLLVMAERIRNQLRANCTALKIKQACCNGHYDLICKAFCHGFFMQVAELVTSPGDGSDTYRILSSGLQAKIHPSSCLFGRKPAYLLFNELTYTNQLYIRDVTVINSDYLQDILPTLFNKHRFAADTRNV